MRRQAEIARKGFIWAVLLTAGLIVVGGCQKTTKTDTSTAATPAQEGAPGAMPEGHPPLEGMPSGMTDVQGPTDQHDIALKATGLNSSEELNRALAKLDDPALKTDFENAYRYSFSAKQAQRNYPMSVQLAEKVATARPTFAPAYRVLGYALFNTGQQTEALNAYNKAVEIDPNYGEAHYALAFMYAMGDVSAGREHFKKAMELGVPDERGLGERFYSGVQ